MQFVELADQFPDPQNCPTDDPCAISTELNPSMVLQGYRRGFFPWGEAYGHPLWYCPDPRFVLFTEDLKYSKSLRPILNQNKFELRLNTSFSKVIKHCKKIERDGQERSWITDETIHSFERLHKDKKAWSIEAWQEDILVGGLYGLMEGRVFFGESMFSKVPNASKAVFVLFVKFLRKNGVQIIDCQYHTSHLERFGARHIGREAFLQLLNREISKEGPKFYSGVLDNSD